MAAFVDGRLPFTGIVDTVARVLDEHEVRNLLTVADVVEAETWARRRADELTSGEDRQLSFWIGVLIFAVGILVSVCLHEAGHLLTAKRFGMKATQYFAGFGPTVFSFRRGETEYGLKAVPAGGFVKIVGMTPLEEVAAGGSRPSLLAVPALAAHRRAGRRVGDPLPARRCSSSTPRRSPPACPTRPPRPSTR